MNSWTRCLQCGGVNDHDATHCYLCGCQNLADACPHCHTPFTNPLDTRCPVCNEPYTAAESDGERAEFEANSGET